MKQEQLEAGKNVLGKIENIEVQIHAIERFKSEGKIHNILGMWGGDIPDSLVSEWAEQALHILKTKMDVLQKQFDCL
jgi:hypothetical protein